MDQKLVPYTLMKLQKKARVIKWKYNGKTYSKKPRYGTSESL